jgi:cellulose synthase/poly-beta-1,6-N-acetylglucosamine synthase-like glycosyltransferase
VARNEASTVGAIVRSVKERLVEGCRLVDEIIVVDDHSTDATAEVASASGARTRTYSPGASPTTRCTNMARCTRGAWGQASQGGTPARGASGSSIA